MTVQTGRPLARDQLLPTLETLLRASNAVLVREGEVYPDHSGRGCRAKRVLTPRLGQGAGVWRADRALTLCGRHRDANDHYAVLPEGGVLERIQFVTC